MVEDIHHSLKSYLEIMKFLANIFGEHTEVVLHDLTREEQCASSMCAVTNI